MTTAEPDPDDKALPEPPYPGRPSRIGVREYVVVVAWVGVVAAIAFRLVVSPVRTEREDNHREQQRPYLASVRTALFSYYAANSRFPPVIGSRCPQGWPCSWRVFVLPHLPLDSSEVIYAGPGRRVTIRFEGRYRAGEPWDSPHNQADALPIMPHCFGDVRRSDGQFQTHCRMFVGGGAALDHPEGVRLEDLADPANTLLVVEARESVPWTQPEGLPYDPGGPIPTLGWTFTEGFYGVFADGSIRFIWHDTDERTIRGYITGRRAGCAVPPNAPEPVADVVLASASRAIALPTGQPARQAGPEVATAVGIVARWRMRYDRDQVLDLRATRLDAEGPIGKGR